LISNRIAFLRPVANRVASKLPTAPPESRAVNRVASSTVTGPISTVGVPPAPPAPPADAVRPADAEASGRSFTKVSASPLTPVMSWPDTN
jgi:hypothetical protein